MENKTLEENSNESESYCILNYRAKLLPINYRGMIFSKWLRGIKFSNDYFKLIDSDAFFKAYQRYIESILQREDAHIKIASLPDDSDVALGFSVIEGPILHYVHVHKENRQMGIGKSLLPKDFKYTTHLTKLGLIIWANKYKEVKFNPFL